VRDVVAAPELAHHVDGLLEHLEPHVAAGPLVAEDVLVEVLARADAEEEPARHHRGRRGGRLRDERGVDPDQRARDAGAETDAVRRLGDSADHAPHERRVSLLVHPRVEVIGDDEVLEPRVLGGLRVLDEIARGMLL